MTAPLTTLSMIPPSRACVLADVAEERERQIGKWELPNGTGGYDRSVERNRAQDLLDLAVHEGKLTFAQLLQEQVYEAFAETDPARLRAELVKVAAVAVRWIEQIDRRPRP